jgi:hypothetical protein
MTMPGDLLSGTLIEIARELREKRVTARKLIEAAIAAHERFGERLHAYSLPLGENPGGGGRGFRDGTTNLGGAVVSGT